MKNTDKGLLILAMLVLIGAQKSIASCTPGQQNCAQGYMKEWSYKTQKWTTYDGEFNSGKSHVWEGIKISVEISSSQWVDVYLPLRQTETTYSGSAPTETGGLGMKWDKLVQNAFNLYQKISCSYTSQTVIGIGVVNVCTEVSITR